MVEIKLYIWFGPLDHFLFGRKNLDVSRLVPEAFGGFLSVVCCLGH